jgi:hypothetical protein
LTPPLARVFLPFQKVKQDPDDPWVEPEAKQGSERPTQVVIRGWIGERTHRQFADYPQSP